MYHDYGARDVSVVLRYLIPRSMRPLSRKLARWKQNLCLGDEIVKGLIFDKAEMFVRG